MFWPEAITFEQFYDSAAGKIITSRIEQKIIDLWPDARHETIIGVGFAGPYLEALQAQNKIGLFMPTAQGVLHWPKNGKNKACLAEESSLPLQDNSVDRIILVHALEYVEHPHLLIREMWRVLAPKGKLLIIVPNRLGVWAHLGKTPFAAGRAFHQLDLTTLLQDAFFLPLHTGSLLFAPPVFPHLLAKSALLENIGNFWLQPFGGILIAEGEKQLYSVSTAKGNLVRNTISVLAPG